MAAFVMFYNAASVDFWVFICTEISTQITKYIKIKTNRVRVVYHIVFFTVNIQYITMRMTVESSKKACYVDL